MSAYVHLPVKLISNLHTRPSLSPFWTQSSCHSAGKGHFIRLPMSHCWTGDGTEAAVGGVMEWWSDGVVE